MLIPLANLTVDTLLVGSQKLTDFPHTPFLDGEIMRCQVLKDLELQLWDLLEDGCHDPTIPLPILLQLGMNAALRFRPCDQDSSDKP